MPQTAPTGQKLRNSCDSCNLAKVKCSKGRPSCTRCEAQNVQCIYGISMRAGKHRAQGSNIQKPKPPTPPSMPAAEAHSPTNMFGTDEKSHSFINPSLTSMMDSMPMTNDWSSMMTDDAFLMNDPMSLDHDIKPRHFSNTFTDADFTQGSSDFSTEPTQLLAGSLLSDSPGSSYHDFMGRRSLTESTLNSASTAPTSRRSSPSSSCNCNQRVLKELLTLTQVPEIPSAYDTALNQNKQVISFCHSLLEDPAHHHHDISFVMTLMALIAKVISVYDAVYNPYSTRHTTTHSLSSSPLTAEHIHSFRDLDPSDPLDMPSMSAPVTNANNSPFSSSTNLSGMMTPSTPTNGQQHHQLFNPMRLSLGSYRLDEKDEEKLRWDMFKMELGKVAALVTAFEQKFCDGMMPTEQTRYEAKAYEDMVYYLQKRLRVAMQNPKQRGRGNSVAY